MKRLFAILAVTLAATLGIASIGAGPAFAGSKQFGAKACVQGSLFTEATGNLTVIHQHNSNGAIKQKSYANGASFVYNRYYPSLQSESAASIQNGTGTLQNPNRNCED